MRLASSIIFLMALSATCHAYTYTGRGYTPGAWPASNVSPRALGGLDARNWDDAAPTGGTKRIGSLKDIWAGDIYHGLWEKTVISQNIAAGSNLVKATWYRTERANLVAFKQAFPGIATGFVDFAETPSSVASYMTTSLTQVLPTFTVSNLLIRAGLPTNYLTYTPYRMIGGYGSLDGAVTPSNVQAGFTVKDYGWDGLKRMITNLTCTQVRPTCNSFGRNTAWSGCGTTPYQKTCYDYIPAGSYTEAAGVAGASPTVQSNCRFVGLPYYQAAFSWMGGQCEISIPGGVEYTSPCSNEVGRTTNMNYAGRSGLADAGNGYFIYTNRNEANVPRTVELYGNVTNQYANANNGTPPAFNSYGTGFTEGNWHLIESETLSATAPYSRTEWGVNTTTPLGWPSIYPTGHDNFSGYDPSVPEEDRTTESYAACYRVLGLFLLNRWTCYY